jgi:hypothetical protein
MKCLLILILISTGTTSLDTYMHLKKFSSMKTSRPEIVTSLVIIYLSFTSLYFDSASYNQMSLTNKIYSGS